MILSVLIIAVVGGVAYFHYAQGFFSATFSAVCAAVAAVLAVSYHEPVITGLLQGAMADYAVAMVLIALFAIIYIVLRTVCDTLVPGNIRLPNTVDRVGGGVMGVIAGIFTGGIVALAAQALPFGPSIGGYARYEVETREEVNIPASSAGGRQRTADVHDQLTENTFTAEKQKKLLLPCDEWLLAIVQGLSNGGSLEGDRTLASLHPSYPDELFAQRLGIQIGASHTAINLQGKTPEVTVPDPGVFRVDQDLTKTSIDAEVGQVHDREAKYTKGPKDLQLVVRVMFSKDAADSDHKVRLAPASVRLCADGVNYFPIGTLEKGSQLWANKADDYLIIDVGSEDRGADFVFLIDDPSGVVSGGAKDPVQKIKDGVFVEVKRYAKIDLSGREVKVGVPANPKVKVERKAAAVEKAKEKGGGAASGETSAAAGGAGGAAAAAAAPASTDFVFTRADISKALFSPINVGSPDADIRNGQIPDGTFATQSKQFTQLDIQPTRSLTLLGQGGYAVAELFEPNGKKMVQIVGTPPAEGGDAWAWGQLSKWQLTDAAGHSYTPAGAFAKVKKEQSDRMVASYRSEGAPKDIGAEDGRPLDVWIAFLVPPGTHLKKLTLNGKSVADLDQVVQ